jgi:hypothetical protein
MEVVGIFYGHLVYFTAIWYILCPFGICYGNLVYFPLFWYVVSSNIWQPCSVRGNESQSFSRTDLCQGSVYTQTDFKVRLLHTRSQSYDL